MEPRAAVLKLIEHKHLTALEAESFMNHVMKGEVSEIFTFFFFDRNAFQWGIRRRSVRLYIGAS